MHLPPHTYWSHAHRIRLTIWDLFDLSSPSIDFCLYGMFTASVVPVITNDCSFIFHDCYPTRRGRHKIETEAVRGRMVIRAYEYKTY